MVPLTSTPVAVLYGMLAVVPATVGAGGFTVTVTRAGADVPVPVAVYENVPVPKKPGVGVKRMVLALCTAAPPFVGAPETATLVNEPVIALVRFTSMNVLKAVVTDTGAAIG